MNNYLITFINNSKEIVVCDIIIPDEKNDGRFLNAILNNKVFKTYNSSNVLSVEILDI